MTASVPQGGREGSAVMSVERLLVRVWWGLRGGESPLLARSILPSRRGAWPRVPRPPRRTRGRPGTPGLSQVCGLRPRSRLPAPGASTGGVSVCFLQGPPQPGLRVHPLQQGHHGGRQLPLQGPGNPGAAASWPRPAGLPSTTRLSPGSTVRPVNRSTAPPTRTVCSPSSLLPLLGSPEPTPLTSPAASRPPAAPVLPGALLPAAPGPTSAALPIHQQRRCGHSQAIHTSLHLHPLCPRPVAVSPRPVHGPVSPPNPWFHQHFPLLMSPTGPHRTCWPQSGVVQTLT